MLIHAQGNEGGMRLEQSRLIIKRQSSAQTDLNGHPRKAEPESQSDHKLCLPRHSQSVDDVDGHGKESYFRSDIECCKHLPSSIL